MPDFTTKVEEESDEEEEEEGEGGNADEDFETAWDILDVARVIFEKGEDKDTKLKLADVHLCLGDVSLETGNLFLNSWLRQDDTNWVTFYRKIQRSLD